MTWPALWMSFVFEEIKSRCSRREDVAGTGREERRVATFPGQQHVGTFRMKRILPCAFREPTDQRREAAVRDPRTVAALRPPTPVDERRCYPMSAPSGQGPITRDSRNYRRS